MNERILAHLSDCDEIWHAGDIGPGPVLEPLLALATVRAVYGNIDSGELRREWPLDARFTVEGVRVWMTHIAGRPGRYDSRIREGLEKYPVDVFVCGHSHICLVEFDRRYRHLHLNPGAAGWHGFHKVRTLLKFELDAGRVRNMRVVELGPRATSV